MQPTTPPQSVPVPTQDPAQLTMRAANECRAKRLRGEILTHAAAAQCSNAPMLAAFNDAHYRHMDLVRFLAAKHLELATRIDRGELTEQQAEIEAQKILASLQETARRRDSGVR
jgi:hypothetical protein